MGSQTEPIDNQPIKPVTHFLQSTASNLLSLLAAGKMSPSHTQQPSRIFVPITFTDSPKPLLPTFSQLKSAQPDSLSSKLKSFNGISSSESISGFPSTVRIAGLNSNGKYGGPAFVGQVFSMCDLSGTGLMAVSTHFDIPFISKRTPEWLKKMFAAINKSQTNGPIFRFFMDLGDAVSYVKRLNIPSGVVGACRLDLAFEHYKEKPELFQFVPNEKQVKAANKLLKETPHTGGSKKIDGVPVFSAQNLDIAIATTGGIKWYTPYFFDKNMLDNILEESVDQHFQALIQTRQMQRRGDVVDDSLAADVVEELGDNLWEPPEVQEVMEEMGHSGIPFSVISKAAEMQLLYSVDRVMLGNRWLRKAAGIQPKFPYLVDSFEKRSAASFLRTFQSIAHCETEQDDNNCQNCGTVKDNVKMGQGHGQSSFFPFGNWFGNLGSKHSQTEDSSEECVNRSLQPNPFLPKITMVGISTGEAGQMNRSSLKKTMEDMTRELEEAEQGNTNNNSSYELSDEYRDPLFVANVGDYCSGLVKAGSGGNN